ncbi:MAG TPA: hypothetical protein VFV02_15895 [Acidimicrobiales bacterium]|nr:hypothetical protein [Acidimicrobiales bacterium]
MTARFPSLVQGSPQGGHPIWHFAVVAGAGIAVFAGIKASEYWKHSGHRLPRPSPPIVLLALLGATSSVIHAMVCREHFREWVLYGVFFVVASALQAAWSVLVLIRPSRTLLAIGVAGNAAVVLTFVVSRTLGMPFGPAAFQPEAVTTLGIAATVAELAVEYGAFWLLVSTRRDASSASRLVSSASSIKGLSA